MEHSSRDALHSTADTETLNRSPCPRKLRYQLRPVYNVNKEACLPSTLFLAWINTRLGCSSFDDCYGSRSGRIETTTRTLIRTNLAGRHGRGRRPEKDSSTTGCSINIIIVIDLFVATTTTRRQGWQS
ncbi:uncharacterized protein LOC114873964 isoform X2 [Osmia bicornis bicornis]|uniref:uncharacterized protein LOC114873964 isoform X2 n=1 Tax=Osmia bicornis bicornis TaxID=1437191 RepID=UPI001EAEBB62|nr:uncharacterized protein LOC114873964 isoform X2 [Osmia bicornis bicornis]